MNCGGCGRITSRLLSRCIACGAAVDRPSQSETARASALLLNTIAANALTRDEAGAPEVAADHAAAAARTTRPSSGHFGPLEPGNQFGPRYKILRLLGMGGMGAVYEVHDNELNESVALKVIKF